MSDRTKKGYNCQFVEEPPAGLKVSCALCNKILREPQHTVCCGKNTCYNCISNVQSENNGCPVCQTLKDFEIFPNTGVKNDLYALNVYCEHMSKGCEWTGKLGELDEHLNFNPPIENYHTGCDYTPIPCPFVIAGCSEVILRKDTESHLSDTFIRHQLMQVGTQSLLIVKVQALEEENQLLKVEKSQLRKTVDKQQSRIQYSDQQVEVLQLNIEDMKREREMASRTGMAIGPVRFIMEGFEQHKQTPKDNWFSPHFWTHPQGYKVCLCIIANGMEGPSQGQYTSILIHLMKGEFDDQLKWPFRGIIEVQLLDQEGDGEPWTKELTLNHRTPDEVASRVIGRERSKSGWGLFQYIPHANLEPKYLKNDRLFFQIGPIKFE